jgi:hypothetical protein
MLPPVHPGSLQLSPSHHLVVSCALISSLPVNLGRSRSVQAELDLVSSSELAQRRP